MADVLNGGGKNDREAALKIKRWVGLSPKQAEAEFFLLVDVFFREQSKNTIGTKVLRELILN